MNSQPRYQLSECRPAKRGVALVISLGFIVLLTMLVTSYLVSMRLDRLSTHNYSQSVRSQELARGAVVEILEDVRSEILANSTAVQYDDVTVYVPNTPADAQPKRVGFEAEDYTLDAAAEPDKLPTSLLQVSRHGEQARTSDVATSERALNGRYLSARRWNKAKLLGVDPPAAFSDKPPEWVYVTRSGSGVNTAGGLSPYTISADLGDQEQILGRYAFVVYDQGGLIDLNAAGKTAPPTEATALEAYTTAQRGKSALAYAELSALPGFKEMDEDEMEELVDALVNWRHKGAIAAAGTDNYPEAVRALQEKGFLELEDGDSPLFGRQDILNYFEKKNLPEAALPYLTHFTRAVTSPNWGPEINSDEYDTYIAGADNSTAIDYRDEAENAASINPRLTAVRFDDGHDIIHYRDDGTIEPASETETEHSYTVSKGDAAVQRRFSLARLAWLGHEGPNAEAFEGSLSQAEREQAIYDCFGLRWVDGSTFPRWEYARNGSNRILTLDEVQKEGREPDFFELLKAVILTGSLGRDPGDGYATPRHGNNRHHTGGIRFHQIYSGRDMQVLQIGANIIDQADEDRYPTAIHSNIPLGNFTSPEVFSDESREYFSTVTGIENIPYLARVWNPYATVGGASGTKVRGWWAPEMWNPHRLPADPDAPSPEAYRIRAFGVSQSVFATDPNDTVYNADEYIYADPINHDDAPEMSYLTFTDNGRFYKAPARVQVSDDYTADPTPAINKWDSGYDWERYPFLGIFTGEIDRPEPVEDTMYRLANPPPKPVEQEDGSIVMEDQSPRDSFFNCRTTFPLGEPPPTLVTEYKGADGNWRPAGIFARFNVNRRNSTRAADGGTMKSSFVGAVVRSSNSRFDFRTDRFSCYHMENDSWGYQDKSSGYGRSSDLWDDNGTRASHFFLPLPGTGFYAFQDLSAPNTSALNQNPALIAQNRRYDPVTLSGSLTAGESTFYTDPDGVVRPGDAYRVNASSGHGNVVHFDDGDAVPPTGEEARQPYRSVVLDRPFHSVGELGYVFRDVPYRTLDFWTKYSADAGLLEVFSVSDEPRVAAGKVNINAAPLPVVGSILKGAGKHATDDTIPALNDA